MDAPAIPPLELALMQRVKSVYGSWIDEAIATTPSGIAVYPSALLAALAANETGGDPTKSRYEASVAGKIIECLVDKKPFGSIGYRTLNSYLENDEYAAVGSWFDDFVNAPRLKSLSTSWGPTQIMGYEALAGGYALSELTSLQTHFKHTLEMLDGFRKEFHLLTSLFPGDPFFRCWNTGRPDGKTFDPAYTANGLARMAIYAGLV